MTPWQPSQIAPASALLGEVRARIRVKHYSIRTEQAYCDSRKNPAESYAGRFAGKEAVGKALGCGVRFTWKEIEIVGRPNLISDPRFVDVPMQGLMSERYADWRRTLIDPKRAWPEMPPAGDPQAPAMIAQLHELGSTSVTAALAPSRASTWTATSRMSCSAASSSHH